MRGEDGTGAALRKNEFLTFSPLETTPETTRGPSPEAPGAEPLPGFEELLEKVRWRRAWGPLGSRFGIRLLVVPRQYQYQQIDDLDVKF